ncbi:MAG TPA: AI-2E family transporter [Polyangiales bacterium]|nr:AI-2E family transporter [Polyangiales bacterium]
MTTSITPIPPRPEDFAAPLRPEKTPHIVLRWVVFTLVAGALFTFAPLWVPLVLASWSAILARPIQRRLSRLVGGRTRAAGVVTVVLVITVLTPIVIMVLSLAGSAVDLITRVSHTEDGPSALSAMLASSEGGPAQIDFSDTRQVFDLLRRHGASAIGAARLLSGALAALGIAMFVFVFAFYTFLVDGRRTYEWLLERVPLARNHFERLSAAFEETGRGLVISMGGTSLFQGGLATIGYLIIGAPQPFMLGMLTAIGSFIPVVGTALVWVPLTLALLAMGRDGQAIAVVVIGLVVSSLDNFVRPWLSRYGQLQLPTFVIFIAMMGGIAAFGGAGLLLGPLFVRLASEVLEIWREDRKSLELVTETTTPTR